MSGLIKSIKKGVSKAWKFVKKTVKKVASSKVFKAVVLAAAVYFTAGAAAGMLAPTAGAATAGIGGALAPGAGVLAAGNGGLALAGSTAAAAGGGVAAAGASSLGGTLMAGLKTAGTLAAKNPQIVSTLLSTGGQMIGQASQAKAEQKAYDKDKAELLSNNNTQLPITERLNQIHSRFGAMRDQNQQNQPVQQKIAGSYYDPRTDSYLER